MDISFTDYMGCYKDERIHALSWHMGRSEYIEDCIKKCKRNHFEYAGLEVRYLHCL